MQGMKVNWLSWTVFMLFMVCVVSCATNMELRKRQSEASRNLGEAYMAEGGFTAALREFLRAEKLYPRDPYLQNNLGLSYLAKERPNLAIVHFKKALDIKPDYASAKNNLGTAYLVKGDWDAAIACFKELSEDILYATPHYPLSNLGFAYYNKQEYELAEKYYHKALKVESGFAYALRGLGRTYIAMGRTLKAVEIFEEAVKNTPHFTRLHFDLARAYALSHEYEKALSVYNKIIELAPNMSIADDARREAKRLILR